MTNPLQGITISLGCPQGVQEIDVIDAISLVELHYHFRIHVPELSCKAHCGYSCNLSKADRNTMLWWLLHTALDTTTYSELHKIVLGNKIEKYFITYKSNDFAALDTWFKSLDMPQ